MAPNQVNNPYPYLRVHFSVRGHQGTALALLDTGFTGHLAIPTDALNGNLGLPDAVANWELANGSIVNAPLYSGNIHIEDFPAILGTITVVGNEYILGRGILDNFKITLDHGKRIIIEK